MHRHRSFAACVVLFLGAADVLAHYPWYALDPKDGKHGRVHFYFEEGPRPGDGQYLDPFLKKAAFAIRTGKGDPMPVKMVETKDKGNRWLTLPLEVGRPRGIECTVEWGVYKGQLLFYYAKFLDVAAADQLESLTRTGHLPFDLVPRADGKEVEVLALWQGKPKSGLKVLVGGPGFFASPTTDAAGKIRFEPGKAGAYRLRTQFVEAEPAGKVDGMAYKGIRRTVTLTLPWSAATAGQ